MRPYYNYSQSNRTRYRAPHTPGITGVAPIRTITHATIITNVIN
jgi:hypothetical protein